MLSGARSKQLQRYEPDLTNSHLVNKNSRLRATHGGIDSGRPHHDKIYAQAQDTVSHQIVLLLLLPRADVASGL
jgi:hypothetical protein